ncbi:hypothetical protein BDV24DRAFT_139215 [Aspergillus arachidicola]|uniref:Uncharacterized protein n=1 Tax=Aspergillus arachidicola TaxID=656916 RepID=A0A5N6XXA9_9EURO|nr:hypothetical protein BDV24DRAFT_139215 [Aspergillus arachidicola]
MRVQVGNPNSTTLWTIYRGHMFVLLISLGRRKQTRPHSVGYVHYLTDSLALVSLSAWIAFPTCGTKSGYIAASETSTV